MPDKGTGGAMGKISGCPQMGASDISHSLPDISHSSQWTVQSASSTLSLSDYSYSFHFSCTVLKMLEFVQFAVSSKSGFSDD